MEQYINFIQTGEKHLIDGWLDQIDAAYAAGNLGMTDAQYDDLVDFYTRRFGPRKVVGAPAQQGDVPLPIAMMSLDKVFKHEPNVLQNWIKNNPGPYVAMDKINGNPGLYTIENGVVKLYKRGNGTTGPEISHILPYLNLPVLPFDVHIKGELVIDKADYAPHKGDGPDQYKTNLSMVAGLTNWRNTNPNPEHLKLIKFISFDMSFPKNQDIELNMSQTLEHLEQYGFRTPFHLATPALTLDWLDQLYDRQKKCQTYDVDGIVVMADRKVKYQERLIRDRNPRYAIAYKTQGDIYETTVTHIVWEASKRGVLTPVVHVEPVAVGDTGFTIRHPTGHNANFLRVHGIGPGARVQVIHNTVPKIVGTTEGGRVEPALPPPDLYPPGTWDWNETGKEIVLHDHATDEIKIAKLYEFFRKEKINAKGWGEKTVERLYNAGFNTLKKLLETDKAGFMAVPIESVGEATISNLVASRDAALPEASPATIMAGTVAFDHGIGSRKIQKVLNVYPNILDDPDFDITDADMADIEGLQEKAAASGQPFGEGYDSPVIEKINRIVDIESYALKTAIKFIKGLYYFKNFIADIPILQKAVRGQLPKTGNQTAPPKPGKAAEIQAVGTATGETLAGKIVVFSGFRDAALENYIRQQGGDVKNGVSKKVNFVIVDGPKGEGSSKQKKANQYGIPTPNIAEFKGRFGIP